MALSDPKHRSPRLGRFDRTGWLVLLSLMGVGLLVLPPWSEPFSDQSLNSGLGAFLILLGGYLVLRRRASGSVGLIEVDVVFLGVYSAALLGHLLSQRMGVVEWSSEVVPFPDRFGASLVVIYVGMTSFMVGFNLVAIRRRDKPRQRRMASRDLLGRTWARIGTWMVVLGSAFHIVGLALVGPSAIRDLGYAGIQDPVRYSGGWLAAAFLAAGTWGLGFGLACHVAGSLSWRRKLFVHRWVLVLWLLMVVIYLAEGDRGGAFAISFPAVLAFHFRKRPFRGWEVAAMAVATLVIFSVVAEVRGAALNVPGMIARYSENSAHGAERAGPFSFVAEVGGSFNTVNIVVNDVPGMEPFWNGRSWMDSVIHVVPLLQGWISRNVRPSISPSSWFTTTYWGEDRAGRGFSLAAEGYLNLGLFGVIFELGLIGLLCGWLSGALRDHDNRVLILGLMGVSLVLLSVRNHLNILIAPLVHAAILVNLIPTVFQRRTRYRVGSGNFNTGDPD